jgi:acyl-CoA thioesterase
MEASTNRGVLWVTTQFVATAQMGDTVECTTEVMALGRNIAQVQVTGRAGGRVMFSSLGSTAIPREGGLEGQYLPMPAVTPPEENEPVSFGMGRPEDIRGFTEQVEYRAAGPLGEEDATAPMLLWARLNDHPITPAGIAFMADMVPAAVVKSAGLMGGGPSLDNSLRFGRIPPDQEWVLLELRGQMAVGAHGHGSVNVWSPDGHLLAVGGQSVNIVHAASRDEMEKMMMMAATGEKP